MTEIYKVDQTARKFLFEGVQGENESRSIQFDITPWTTELGNGAVTATAKRPTDAAPYPVTVTRDGNTVTWKPTSTDTAFDGVGSFQLEYTVDSVLAKTCIWSTMVAPSLDPAGDPPDPYDNWLAEMREIAADAIQAAQDAEQAVEDAQDEVENAEAWAVGQRGGVDVPSTDPAYENNAKYWAEQSLANQYGAYIVKSASGEIASFSDGADNVPMKSLKVAIVPKQAGSGTPSPDNVRAITGWTGANVYAGGHNYAGDLESGSIDSTGAEAVDSNAKRTPFIPVTEGMKVLCEWKNADAGYRYSRIALYNSSKAFVSFAYNSVIGAGQTHSETVTIPSGVAYLRFCSFNCPPQIIYKVIPQITTYPISFSSAGTVYGGELDVTTGVLTITNYMKTADGTEPDGAYVLAPSGNMVGLYIGASVVNDVGISNAFKHAAKSWAGFVEGEFEIFSNTAYFYVPAGRTIANAKAYVAQLGGVQFLGELRTPTTVQLTPAQVATLLGANNVWSDAGAVEVEYRADPTLAYAELANVIVSLGGNI